MCAGANISAALLLNALHRTIARREAAVDQFRASDMIAAISASGTTPARSRFREGMAATSYRERDDADVRARFHRRLLAAISLPTPGLPIYVFSSGIICGDIGLLPAWLSSASPAAAGLLVDRVTGAMYDHDPHVINVTLQPQQ